MTEIYTSSNAKVFTGTGDTCYCKAWNHSFFFKLILTLPGDVVATIRPLAL